MPTYCLECNATIDEENELAKVKQPCPQCGSVKRAYEMTLISYATIGTNMRSKGYAAEKSRKKGLLFESFCGDSYSVTLGRFVKINQLVDHKAKRYTKKVVDPLTGETLRDVDEPLQNHQGRGSAKKKTNPKKSL